MADSTFFKMPFQIFLQKRSFNFVNQFKSLSFHLDKWNFPPNAHPGQHKDLQETLWPWKSSTSWQENQLRTRRGSPRSRRTSPRSKITSLQHATGARRHFYRERTANRQSFLNQMNMRHQFFMNTRDEKSWINKVTSADFGRNLTELGSHKPRPSNTEGQSPNGCQRR